MVAGSPVETAWRTKYEVLRPLAVGGMAELHLVRAHDPGHPGRLMVVKRLHPRLAINPEFVKMFLDEGRIASTLRHPNVVEVHEIGEEAEQYYIAMEHLHGHDLRAAMGRMIALHTPVQIEQALTIARAVAAGLHYTHERTGTDGKLLGIVHRDVSPHNVILTFGGEVKIVDFGVAKASTQLSRTRTGVLKGKVAYMAPEQARGLPLDRRSDVFCIGILLWEMTTGRWLYRRRTELETLNAVVESKPPRPSRLVAHVPRDLEKLVMKTLARSRDERWASAGELIDAIDELARRRRLALGPAAVSALMATAFGDELAAWRAAQSSGTSLADHLVAQVGAAVAHRTDEDDDELPPVAALGTVAGEYAPRPRWLWPVIGAAAVIAAVGIVIAVRGLGASPAPVPAPTPTPAIVEPITPPSAHREAAAPSVPTRGAGATADPGGAARPTKAAAKPGGPAAQAGKLLAKPAAPGHVAAGTASPSAEPASRKRAPPRSTPTLDELDKVPP